MFRIPGYIKAASEALQALLQRLDRILDLLATYVEIRAQGGNLEERVESIERGLAQWEADVEAELTRAESRFKAARAAEERARGKEKRAQELQQSLDFDEEGVEELPAEYLELLQRGNAEGGEAEGVQPVRESVGRPLSKQEQKARLRAIKFGG